MSLVTIVTSLSKILPVIYSLIGFGFLIAIHELGHFSLCKLFKIHTPTFSIGFGPEIIRRKIGSTDFRLAAIPLGGYVEIAGLAEVGQGEQEFAQDTSQYSFKNKPYWQKACVLCGGVLFNMLFAYLVFCFLFFTGSQLSKPSINITKLIQNSAAERAGLKPGDSIIGINNITFSKDPETIFFTDLKTLQTELKKYPQKQISLTIKRESEVKTLNLTLDSRQEDNKEIGVLGAFFQAPIPKLSFLKAIIVGVNHTNNYIINLIAGIKHLITSRSLQGAMGPVMMLSEGANFASKGFMSLLMFLALISLGLALMNILPIGALDGGQLLFATIESIIRRPIPETIKISINLASWIFFILLTLYITYREIGQLFGSEIYNLYTKIISLFR
jgi:regulator of sigma E protease